MSKSIKTFLLLILVFCLIILSYTPANIVYAENGETTLTIFADGTVEASPTHAELYGTIEYVDLNEYDASSFLQTKKDELKNLIKEFNSCELEITYNDTYPINTICERPNAYKSQLHFVIKLSNIDNLIDMVNKINNISHIKLSSLQLLSLDDSNYIEAMKQAIINAEIKAEALANQNLKILEINEIEQYYSNSIYLTFENIDLTNLPNIKIQARVEVEFLI